MCAVRARGLVPHPQRHADPVQWHHLSSPTGAGANDNLSPSSTLTDLIAVAIGISLLGVPLLLVGLSQL
jgi:Zn-dependent M28 family amino/carboxypeptidase